MKTLTNLCLITLGTLFTAMADDAPKSVEAQLKVLLEATQNNDIEKFESVCDKAMQEAITPQILEQVSNQVAEQMKAGYEHDFMGEIDKLVHKTYYWKIDFENDQTPDVLAELTISDGKVAGFFIR